MKRLWGIGCFGMNQGTESILAHPSDDLAFTRLAGLESNLSHDNNFGMGDMPSAGLFQTKQ